MVIFTQNLHNWQVYFPQLIGALPALLAFTVSVMHTGWSSPALERYQNGLELIKLSDAQSSWIVTVASLGSIFGVFIMFFINNRVGPKTVILISLAPMLIGWIMIYFARTYLVLIVAKIIAGIGQGLCALNGPIYLAEIASDNCRGAITMLIQVVMALGPLIEFLLVPFTDSRISALISGIITVISILFMFVCPESPYFLVKKKSKKAEKALIQIRWKEVGNELQMIEKTVELQAKNEKGLISLIEKSNRKPIEIMVVIFVIQCFCGTAFFEVFLHVIIDSINDTISTNNFALVLLGVAVLSSFISAGLVDWVGIKFLMITSIVGCAVTLLILGVFFHLQDLKINTTSFIPILTLIIYKFTHGLGILGVPFKLVGELFSTEIKACAVTVTKLAMFATIFSSNVIFQTLMLEYGKCVVFYFMSFGSFLGGVYVYFYVPETKGKSFLEVQEKINGKKIQEHF